MVHSRRAGNSFHPLSGLEGVGVGIEHYQSQPATPTSGGNFHFYYSVLLRQPEVRLQRASES